MTKILIDEAVVRAALESLEYWRTSPETCGFTYKARDAATALRQALANADRPAPAQEPLTPGFAGVTLWLGDARVTQIVTETQIKHEREPGSALTHAAQKCLDLYAGAHGITGENR